MHQLSIELGYTKGQVRRAGKLLSNMVQRSPEVEDAFRIMHNWRMHHAYPMVRERMRLERLAKPHGGIAVGRIKRIASIRKKLARGNVDLADLQDIVGCRAILPTMDDVNEVLGGYRLNSDGGNVRMTNYITDPKDSGYRSVHLIVSFEGRGIAGRHKKRKVEVQLRTELQHVWATAVETVGSMRNEDLKAGEGDPEWLRFFVLMSGCMAEMEHQPRGKHLPMTYAEMVAEARGLADKLNVRENLSAVRGAMQEVEKPGGAGNSIYILRMNADTHAVSVLPRWRDEFRFGDLADDEGEIKQSIEISASNLTELKRAYPNFYLDTDRFLEILGDLGGPITTRRKGDVDLSFLETMAPKRKPEEPEPDLTDPLRMAPNGDVFWKKEHVGRWERNAVGAYFFTPSGLSEYAFSYSTFNTFQDEIERWCLDDY